MSDNSPLELAARIGIDWADQKHAVSLQAAGSDKIERRQLDHTPEAIVEWITGLRQRFQGRQVGIAIETSRGPLVHALLEYDFLILFPVNPRSLARFREAFTPSGAKDDSPDADLLLELLLKHPDRLRRWMPDDEATRALRRLSEHRRKSVELGTKLSQQLRAALKEYFPQALSWVGDDLTSPLACDFLLEWPTLQSLQGVKPNTLRKFYYGHNCRRGDLIEQRIQEIHNATPLTSDPAIIETSVLLVQTLCRQLKALGPSIRRFDDEIQKRFDEHQDAELFNSFPGSGKALAPRLLTLFGSERDRFESAEDIQLLSGIAPVTEQSGKSRWVRWRWSASTFQRQSIHEFAQHSIRCCDWARAYYEIQRERGKKHHVAVRALAYKWLRVMWRCWKDRLPYDDAAYTRSLIERGSPVAARLRSTAAAV
jgi:transposase